MRSEVRMDVNRLIAEVHKRPALWNQKHISYHNREATNRVWSDISAVLKLPKQILKSKWKGLRDTYRAEIKKDLAYRKTKLARNRSAWVHYKSLQFLREQMLPKPPVWERVESSSGGCALMTTAESGGDSGAESSTPNCKYEARKYENLDKNNTEGVKTLARPLLRRRVVNDRRRIVAAAADTTRDPPRLPTSDPTVHQARCEAPNSRIVVSDRKTTENDDANSIEEDSSSEEHDTSPPVDLLADVKIEPPEDREMSLNLKSGLCERDNPITCCSAQTIVPNGEVSLSIGEFNNSDPLGGSPVAINTRYDDNYFFFVSLLPHIRTLPPERRMLLRMQMQQLVYEQVYKKSPPSTDSVQPNRTFSSPNRDKRP